MSNSQEVNVLDVVFKEKTLQDTFDEEQRKKALEFGYEYWDDPSYPGYAGYHYDGRWVDAAEKLIAFFNLSPKDQVLDVCCGKGFLVYDFSLIIPELCVAGVDRSPYALSHGKSEVGNRLILADATVLPFADKSFELVVSLNSLYILPEEECARAIREIERVGKNGFITVNSYRNERERENLVRWDATARTVKSVSQWKSFFAEQGYSGYYYWTIFL